MRATLPLPERDGLEDSWFDRPAQRAALADLRARLVATEETPSPDEPDLVPPQLEDDWFR